MLSLWSAVNPGVWVVDGPAVDGTWTIPADGTVGAQTGQYAIRSVPFIFFD